MNAGAASTASTDANAFAWSRLAPAEGWMTLLLVLLMNLTVAWAIDDAAWVPGNHRGTDSLGWAALGGTLIAFIGAKVGWRRWVVHLVGAGFAALLLPMLTGWALHPEGGSPGFLFQATAESAVRAWRDIVIDGKSLTNQSGHFLLALEIIVWATAQFSTYAVFGHRRPLSAVIIVGAVLVANMAATVNDQLIYLVIFSLAALFLLIRSHAFDEQATWLRRKIGDPSALGSLYLRGGSVFIAAAVVGSLALTTTASSRPLAGAWEDVKPWLVEAGLTIQRFLPAGVESRSIGQVGFGDVGRIEGRWTSDGSLAMTVQVQPGEREPFYWRAVTHDVFDLNGWTWSSTQPKVDVPAGTDVLAGTADEAPTAGRREVSVVIEPAYATRYAMIPDSPLTVDRDTELVTIEDGYFAGLEIDGTDPYIVTALVPVRGNETGELNENALRSAGSTYPESIRAHFLAVPPGAIGPEGAKLLDLVRRAAPDPTNAYDMAKTFVTLLHTSPFVYDDDVRDLACSGMSAVECFATFKRGYCMYYASTMAILMRQAGFPTRIAQGFLPGDRNLLTGEETVRNNRAHAWVEVYFPGYGWVDFDPTGNGLAQLAPLPSGPPQSSTKPSASLGSTAPGDQEGPNNPPRTPAVPGTPTGRTDNTPVFIVIAMLLLVAVGGLAFIAWRRGPRGPVTAEGAFSSVSRLASRFGFAPRPTQTAYEYATALGDVLPEVKPELHTVARSKVEVAYGRRTLDSDAAAALREAYRRLRVALLRLLFRRKERFGRR
jgi:transglutaminase-like putative cysteine protease